MLEHTWKCALLQEAIHYQISLHISCTLKTERPYWLCMVSIRLSLKKLLEKLKPHWNAVMLSIKNFPGCTRLTFGDSCDRYSGSTQTLTVPMLGLLRSQMQRRDLPGHRETVWGAAFDHGVQCSLGVDAELERGVSTSLQVP